MEKIAVLFVDGNQIPLEKVIFKLSVKYVTGVGLSVSHLEFALRGFLLKLCVSDSALSPLPPGILQHFLNLERGRKKRRVVSLRYCPLPLDRRDFALVRL